ncbi:MAG: ANTAR domain-containing protein [Porticoccus sp.]|nr:ANTAR domain-containing protein [Porticoccus sp.]
MKLRIALVEETQPVNQMIKESLEAMGHKVVAQLSPNENLLDHLQQIKPEMLLINVKLPDSTFLQNIAEVNQVQPVPVVLFSEDDSKSLVENIIRCGVSAYVVDGLEANRIEPIINVAMARFTQMQSLQKELADTKQILEERKLIDRAKGILMARRGCNEDEAYNALRKQAMDRNQRIVDVADSVITAVELLADL